MGKILTKTRLRSFKKILSSIVFPLKFSSDEANLKMLHGPTLYYRNSNQQLWFLITRLSELNRYPHESLTSHGLCLFIHHLTSSSLGRTSRFTLWHWLFQIFSFFLQICFSLFHNEVLLRTKNFKHHAWEKRFHLTECQQFL